MTLVAPIELAHSAGGSNTSFVMPSNLSPGNYILYAYIQYPNGVTGVFSNLATVIDSKSFNKQGFDFRPICNALQLALYLSCDELVNSDGSPTPLGSDTIKCILSGFAIGGIAFQQYFHQE